MAKHGAPRLRVRRSPAGRQNEASPGVYCYCVTEPGYTEHGRDTPLWNGARWGEAGEPTDSPSPSAAMRFLANFARSGDPNGEGLPRWEPHAQGAPRYMELGRQLGMRERAEDETARYRLLSRWILSGAAGALTAQGVGR